MAACDRAPGDADCGTRDLVFDRPHDGFLFAKRGEEGLALRAQPTNRVFYSPDIEAAKEVVDRIVAKGPRVFMDEKPEGSDLRLREQWLNMTRAGFFSNDPASPIPLYGVVFEIDEGDDLAEAVEVLRMVEGTLRRRLSIELRVDEAGAIAPAWERLQAALRAWRERAVQRGGRTPAAQLPQAQAAGQAPRGKAARPGNYPEPGGGGPQGGPAPERARGAAAPPSPTPEIAATVVSRLFGEGDPDEKLLALLDREKISIMFLHESGGGEGAGGCAAGGSAAGGPPALAAFEDMGYIFPIRIACSPEAVADPGERLMLMREVDRILQETPNREIDLAVERPARFARVEDVDPYYDALEAFLTDLYRINADPSRLTPFARYIEGVLANRFQPNRLRLRLEGEGLYAGFHSTRTPFAVVPPTRQEVRGIADYLNDLIRNNAGLDACADCALGFICPKAQAEPYVHHARREGEKRIAILVYAHECALHQRIFPLVFEDLIRQASPHAPDGRPLRLDITDDRQLAFRPRDGGEEEGGKRKDEAGLRPVQE